MPQSRFCTPSISGQVVTTIVVAQTSAVRKGRRIQKLTVMRMPMNSTASVVRTISAYVPGLIGAALHPLPLHREPLRPVEQGPGSLAEVLLLRPLQDVFAQIHKLGGCPRLESGCCRSAFGEETGKDFGDQLLIEDIGKVEDPAADFGGTGSGFAAEMVLCRGQGFSDPDLHVDKTLGRLIGNIVFAHSALEES